MDFGGLEVAAWCDVDWKLNEFPVLELVGNIESGEVVDTALKLSIPVENEVEARTYRDVDNVLYNSLAEVKNKVNVADVEMPAD